MAVRFKDYYQVLGIERSASQEDVQRAFRAKARKVHPDVNKAPDAEDRFKELQEAYEVLKDPEKRSRYDRLGPNWEHGAPFEPPPGAGAGGAGGGGDWTFRTGGAGEDFEGVDFSDFFSSLFGAQGGGFRGAGGPRPSRRARGRDHEVALDLDLAEVVRGGTKSVRLAREQRDEQGRPQVDERTYDVKLPTGITEGSRIRLAGQGGAGLGDGPPGDLHFVVAIRPDSAFRVDGFDLRTRVAISPWEAALGATVSLPTPRGTLELKVPPGSSSGQVLRLRGQGLPRSGADAGDLLAELRIVTPKEPSEAERALFEKLRETSAFVPQTRCKAP